MSCSTFRAGDVVESERQDRADAGTGGEELFCGAVSESGGRVSYCY